MIRHLAGNLELAAFLRSLGFASSRIRDPVNDIIKVFSPHFSLTLLTMRIMSCLVDA